MPGCDLHADLPNDSARHGVPATLARTPLSRTPLFFPTPLSPILLPLSHSPTPITNHPSQWFLVVTVTTVGFGDVSPNTVLGQAFISGVILLGIIFLAM